MLDCTHPMMLILELLIKQYNPPMPMPQISVLVLNGDLILLVYAQDIPIMVVHIKMEQMMEAEAVIHWD